MSDWIEREDARKLHAEINQLSGQRTLLSTLGITLFASVGTAIVAYKLELLLSIIVSTILITFLLLIAKLSHTLRWVSRCEALFLETSNATKWEGPWRQFREHRSYEGMKIAETRLFSCLLLLSSILPAHIFLSKEVDITGFMIAVPIIIAILGIFWIQKLEKDTIKDEKTAKAQWERILK